MKKLIVATCAAALMSAVSFAPVSAQTTGPSGGQEEGLKTNNAMDAQAKMKKDKTKKSATTKSSTTTGSSGASTNTTGGAGSMNNNKK